MKAVRILLNHNEAFVITVEDGRAEIRRDGESRLKRDTSIRAEVVPAGTELEPNEHGPPTLVATPPIIIDVSVEAIDE